MDAATDNLRRSNLLESGPGFCEWAWQNKRWDSLEHFNRVQKKWSVWGVVLIGGVAGLGILAAILIPLYQRAQG
jgi:hypothetical protein